MAMLNDQMVEQYSVYRNWCGNQRIPVCPRQMGVSPREGLGKLTAIEVWPTKIDRLIKKNRKLQITHPTAESHSANCARMVGWMGWNHQHSPSCQAAKQTYQWFFRFTIQDVEFHGTKLKRPWCFSIFAHVRYIRHFIHIPVTVAVGWFEIPCPSSTPTFCILKEFGMLFLFTGQSPMFAVFLRIFAAPMFNRHTSSLH